MVASICIIVILYMVAEQRLNELPAAAERASFHAVLEQIKSGVHFAMINGLTSGRGSELRALEGGNPMAFLLEIPSNYGGELELVTDAVRSRNAWYFETSTGQLVYVVGGTSIERVWVSIAGVPVNYGQIRLQVRNHYSALANKWEGIVLAPVYEYRWDRVEEQPVALN